MGFYVIKVLQERQEIVRKLLRVLAMCILLAAGVITAADSFSVPVMAAQTTANPPAPVMTLDYVGKNVVVSWTGVKSASGFEVYKQYKGVWRRYKTINSNAAGSLKMTGSYNCSYIWRIRSFVLVNGTKVYGSFCKAAKIKMPPSGYPTITSGKAESSGVNVITFKTIHASCEGYEIYRAEGATG